MNRDTMVLGATLVTFAAAVTVHVLVAAGLVTRRQPGRAALAFFVPVLAPPFAWRAGMRVRGLMWMACVVGYVTALAFAHA